MTGFGRVNETVDLRARDLCMAVLLVASTAASAAERQPAIDPVTAAFAAADADQDRQLTLDELTAAADDPAVARRDFRIFDFDRNNQLSHREFAAIPGLVPAAQRGALPDPFDHLVDASLEAMDETLKQVVTSDSTTIPVHVFLQYVAASVSPGGQMLMAGAGMGDQQLDVLRLVDPDGNGVVSRSEAERFLEIQLGVRSPKKNQLRKRNGRVVDLGRFQQLDVNQNDQWEPDEFDGTQKQFAALDLDRSETITLDEFTHADGAGWFDPVVWFRDADTNRDGLLGIDEARAATAKSGQVLIEPCIRAFDEDHDGKLTLDDYRLSMLGNPVACWERIPADANDDNTLTKEEFQFPKSQCDLLRLFYFHRLDANHDNNLSRAEYHFRISPPQKLHMLSADGSEFRELFVDENYADIGSPAVSPDERRIAFDGHLRGQGLREQRILMTSIDGTDFQVVCKGLMPTWSKDGKQFACSRYDPQSIWIVNVDGSGGRRLSDGWGAQWSPDGDSIAFTKDNSLCVYDVATDEVREILSAEENPYRLIYWNMSWSPDSRRLAFKGRKDQGFDIASANMGDDGPDLRVHFSGEQTINPDLTWTPDGSHLLASMQFPPDERLLLYQLDLSKDAPPTIVEGIDRSLTYAGGSFTPDGKWIIMQTSE